MRKNKTHTRLTAIAARKGFRSLSELHYEFRKQFPCTWKQFYDATADNPKSTKKLEAIRIHVSAFLDTIQTNNLEPTSYTLRVRRAGLDSVMELFELYTKRYPDTAFDYERFRSAVNHPWSSSDYAIAKKADAILEEFERLLTSEKGSHEEQY